MDGSQIIGLSVIGALVLLVVSIWAINGYCDECIKERFLFDIDKPQSPQALAKVIRLPLPPLEQRYDMLMSMFQAQADELAETQGALDNVRSQLHRKSLDHQLLQQEYNILAARYYNANSDHAKE